MTMFRFCAALLALMIAIACPPLAIPILAGLWIAFDRHRKQVAEARRCLNVFIDYASEQERLKNLRAF